MASEATKGQTPDVYGQLHPVETPELISSKQKEFQFELDKLLNSTCQDDKALLEEAQSKCEVATKPEFILMFLRCEVFNADKAAVRYVSYWKKRKEVFGDEKWTQPLTVSNLSAEQVKCFHTGVFALLDGVHDSVGRSIMYYDPSFYPPKSEYNPNDYVATMWTCIHAALENEETQRYGVILLGDPGRATYSQFDRTITKGLLTALKGALPIRLSAFFIIHPPSFVSIVLPIVKLFMNERMRKRIQFFKGKDETILSQLQMKYGLTKDMLPTQIGGNVKIRHMEWIKKRSESGL